MPKIQNKSSFIITLLPLIAILGVWELLARSSQKTAFLFGSPSAIIKSIYKGLLDFTLIEHFAITGFESLVGLLLGVITGSSLGFVLLFYPKAQSISKYYVIGLSSIPIFALAPMMIIWFGIGIPMKIAMAFFATVFVALFQAYQGGISMDKNKLSFFKLNKATRKDTFWQLIFPSSIDWLLQSLKINSGLAILGAFIGEFIASDKGLGYLVLKAGGLYDVPLVLASTIFIILLTLLFNFLVSLIEKKKISILRMVAKKL